MSIREAMTARLLGEAGGPLCGVYLLTHRESGKRYVGQSIDIARRWVNHRKCVGGRLAAALRKHGPDAFDWEIVELCPREELNDRETYYVWAFGSATPNGYNLKGGGGQLGSVPPEMRRKMSATQQRQWGDPSVAARRAEAIRKACADPTVYVLANVKTGEMARATRAEMRERFGMSSSDTCDLINSGARSRRGWSLTGKEA